MTLLYKEKTMVNHALFFFYINIYAYFESSEGYKPILPDLNKLIERKKK
jgi:hypothetical protein